MIVLLSVAVYHEFIGALNEVFSDIWAAGFPHVVGRNMLLKQTFESGVTVTVFDSRPAITPDVHPRQHLPPECTISSLSPQTLSSNL